MLIKDVKYCYGDIGIIPAIRSDVEHRAECNAYIDKDRQKLPIFTAPMTSVVNEENFHIFEQNGITPILPRSRYISNETRIDYLKNGKWVAVGLDEFEDWFLKNTWNLTDSSKPHVLIDMANGHMSKMHRIVKNAKDKYGFENIVIMVGNIGNPSAYIVVAEAGADYVRLAIGTGNGCITSPVSGVHYPIASLIDETYKIKCHYKGDNKPKIIADGGIRGYADILKAKALGADYVMIGSLLSELLESAALTFYNDGGIKHYVFPCDEKIVVNPNGSFTINDKVTVDKLYKIFYGMASRKGQEDMNGTKKRSVEGIEKILETTTSIAKWKENLVNFTQTTMSYTNIFNINDITPETVDCCIMSKRTQESINK